MFAKYLPSLTYRKPGRHVRNGPDRWAFNQGSNQVSVCVSRLMPGATRPQALAVAGVFRLV